MPPTPQLGHLVQELVVPMVKEEVQEEFSAVTDEVGGEVGCRGNARTHMYTSQSCLRIRGMLKCLNFCILAFFLCSNFSLTYILIVGFKDPCHDCPMHIRRSHTPGQPGVRGGQGDVMTGVLDDFGKCQSQMVCQDGYDCHSTHVWYSDDVSGVVTLDSSFRMFSRM